MITESVQTIAHRWLDKHYPLRQQALTQAAREFCLSQANFELALDWIFHQWTEVKIAKLSAEQPFKNCRSAVQVLAGNTPAMIAQGFLQGLILGIPQSLKIPSRQPSFAQLLLDSFKEVASDLAGLFELFTEKKHLAQFYSRLAQTDLVLAYGSDETISTLKQQLAPGTIFIAHAHAESAALIFKEAATVSYLEKLAYDFLSYDQRGCLSPRLTYIEQGGKLSPADCAKIFAEHVLPPLAQDLPRGGLFPGEAEEIIHQRCLYGFRGTVYCGEDWTLCYDEKPGWPRIALPRFMLFKPFETSTQFIEAVNPVKNRLISLGYAGPQSKIELVKQSLNTRFCRLGEMQKQLLIF